MLLKRGEIWQVSQMHTVSTAGTENLRKQGRQHQKKQKQQEVCGETWFGDTQMPRSRNLLLWIPETNFILHQFEKAFIQEGKKNQEDLQTFYHCVLWNIGALGKGQVFTSLDKKYSKVC